MLERANRYRELADLRRALKRCRTADAAIVMLREYRRHWSKTRRRHDPRWLCKAIRELKEQLRKESHFIQKETRYVIENR